MSPKPKGFSLLSTGTSLAAIALASYLIYLYFKEDQDDGKESLSLKSIRPLQGKKVTLCCNQVSSKSVI
jgi:hypothetical protein